MRNELAERDTNLRCSMCNGRGGRDTLRWSDAIGSTIADWLECSRCDGTGHPLRANQENKA